MASAQSTGAHRDIAAFKKLTSLYVLALSLVALLSISGQALIQVQLVRQSHDSRVVNIAGRQRMLSQRICKEVLAWRSSTEPQESEAYLAQLRESLGLWQTSHDGLLQGSEELGLRVTNSEKLKSMFASLQHDFSSMLQEVNELIRLAESSASDMTETRIQASIDRLLEHEGDYLAAMDAIVFQYDAEAAQRVQRLRTIEFVLLGLTLLVLLAEGLLIFKPVTTKIRQALLELKQTTSELEQAKLAAETANQHKSFFLANVSHDLRTPMNAIIGLTQLAKNTADDEERNLYLEKVSDSADSLLLLLNDLIDLSKIESGKLELRPTLIETKKFTERITTLLQPQAVSKGLEFKIETSSSVPQAFLADELRLQQVLVNLLSNSIKFTSEGAVRLQLDSDSEAAEPRIQITVCDTGEGIALTDQERVFESFTQLQTSARQPNNGVGLGLAICARLVREFGDQLKLVSTPGEGTQISFSLPYLSQQENNTLADQTMSAQSSFPKTPNDLSGRRILVVEDTTVNQLVVGENLRRAGAEVTIVETGAEALQIMECASFDAVLMDLQLPDRGGLEVTQEIRRRELEEDLLSTPIIALTAHAMVEDAERCYAAGMNGYLTKPLRVDQLLATLTNSFQHAQALQESESVSEVGKVWSYELAEPIILDRLDGREDVLQQLIELMIAELPKTIEELAETSERADPAELSILAHRVKGMVSNLAAVRAEQFAKALEDACQAAVDPQVMAPAAELLEQELKALLQELQRLVDLPCS